MGNGKKSLFELTAQVGSPFCAEAKPASTVLMAIATELIFMFSVTYDDRWLNW